MKLLNDYPTIKNLDDLANEAIATVASWHADKQHAFVKHAADYISDWYERMFCLTKEEVETIANEAADFFTD